MRVFVTGASGFIGSATVPELIGAGHEVLGLARSEAAARTVEALGARVLRGDLDNVDALRRGADQADGVIHLAYIHDFTRIPMAAGRDRQAIDTFGATLAGSDRPLVIASGVLGTAVVGRPATEDDRPESGPHPRLANAAATLALAERGVRSVVLRLAPTVHGRGDHGFVATLIRIAREKGVSAAVGAGDNRWPAVHRMDAARLFRLSVESAPAGSVVHGVAEAGIPARTIAETIGRHLGLPVTSVSPEEAPGHFGWMAAFFAMDAPTSNDRTRRLLGWEPTGPGLIEDLDQGHYFA